MAGRAMAVDEDGLRGALIRALREQRGWGTRDLGVAAGMSAGSVSNYENGRRGLYLSQAVRIAAALEVPLSVLVDPVPSGNNVASTDELT